MALGGGSDRGNAPELVPGVMNRLRIGAGLESGASGPELLAQLCEMSAVEAIQTRRGAFGTHVADQTGLAVGTVRDLPDYQIAFFELVLLA